MQSICPDLLEMVVDRLVTGRHGICETVADATGVFPGTVRKIKQRKVLNPRWLTLKPIAEYFLANPVPETPPPPDGAAK